MTLQELDAKEDQMDKSRSRKQIGSLKINFFLEGGERHVFRAYFPVDGTVSTDVQMDAMARVAGELFRKYAERMKKEMGSEKRTK